jgi:hypothetical protein
MPFGMAGSRRCADGPFSTPVSTMPCRSPVRGSSPARTTHGTAAWACTLGPGRLRRIGPKQAILQRSTVEPADDRVHLLGVGRFDEREALGLLRFGVADNFNCVRDQVFGCKPSLDIVRGDPGGQIAQEDGKTHPWLCISVRGGVPPEGSSGSNIMLPQQIKPVNGAYRHIVVSRPIS